MIRSSFAAKGNPYGERRTYMSLDHWHLRRRHTTVTALLERRGFRQLNRGIAISYVMDRCASLFTVRFEMMKSISIASICCGSVVHVQQEMRGKAQRDSPVLVLLTPPGKYDWKIRQLVPSEDSSTCRIISDHAPVSWCLHCAHHPSFSIQREVRNWKRLYKDNFREASLCS